jgi:filamentous hemagglutinin family protein
VAVTPVRLLGSAAVAALLAGHAAAQVATSIAPDTAAGFATGSMVSRTGSVITIAGGVRAGGNLFHSFTTFDLGAGDTAAWTAVDATGVANVVNRVTGGRVSTIAGRIDTQQLPNAAFYFINPAGVLFTDGALLNVPGAAYVSTAADGVKFADGIRFSAVTPDGSNISMAAPQSFGFLGREGPIVIDSVMPTLLPVARVNLSLFASDILMRNTVFAPRTLDIVTTGRTAVSLSLADPFATAPLDGATFLTNAQIFATQNLKGMESIRIATGSFTQQGGVLSSSSFFDGDAGDLLLTARTADVSGIIASNIGENVPDGDGGTVRLNVGSLHVDAGGQVSSSTFGRGHAGDVVVNAGSILVENFGSIGSDAAGSATGHAGRVQIKADAVTVANAGSISSSTNGSGAAGEVRIEAGTLVVDNGSVSSTTLGGSGRGGLVAIEANSIILRNPDERSGIASFTSGDGDAGAVQIKAGSLSLSSGRIFSTSVGSGAAGEISIDVGEFTATDSFIGSDAFGVGRAGVVNLRATNATLINSTLTSETIGPGKGGDVTVNAGSLTLSRKSLVATDTFGSGAAGNVTIKAERVSLESSQIVSQASESIGASGTVRITADRLQLANVSAVSTDTFGAGNAGQIFVKATDVSLAGGSAIASGVREGASGAGGAVVMDTQSLSLTDDALISSSTFGAGAAGDVNIKAGRVTLDASSIESGSDSVSTGDGGTIRLTADETTLQNGSRIITSTFASGDAGQVVITAGRLRVNGSLLASQSSNRATGAAGGLTLTGTSLELTNGGRIETSSVNARMAGPISISMAGPVSVIGPGSHISSENLAAAGGAAGFISIAGAPVRLVDGGLISTNSLGAARTWVWSPPRPVPAQAGASPSPSPSL